MFPAARLVLVPRHPVRAEEVIERVRRSGFECARQSRLEGLAPEIVIGDVMGSLLTLYGVADVAFVGGSLVPHGGHNPIEPALWGLPVVTGCHTFNFDDVMADFREAGGVREVKDASALAGVVAQWLSAPRDGRVVGDRAIRLVEQQRGALERTLGALEPLLSLIRE
jgi:3-deoxy-D-manno-octulosonic-acid transferase